MLDINGSDLLVWGLVLYLAMSVTTMKHDEMAVVTFFGQPIYQLKGGGLKIVPWLVCRLIPFPTSLQRLDITLPPVLPAAAATAEYYVDDIAVPFSAMSPEEKQEILLDPLNRRFEVVLDVALFWRYRFEELRAYLEVIGLPEAGEDLRKAPSRNLRGHFMEIATAGMHDQFGRITISTAVERKQKLSRALRENLRVRVGQMPDPETEEQGTSWGIDLASAQVGPLKLEPSVAAAHAAAAAALSAKQATITAAEAEEKRLHLEGSGRAKATRELAEVVETPAGEKAAGLEVARQVLKEGDKFIIGANPVGSLIAAAEVLKQKEKPAE